MDTTIVQLKKMITETEFSEEGRKKIDEILKDKEQLSEQDIKVLKEAIKTDVILDTVEMKMHEAFLEETDKLLADLRKIKE